MDRGFVDAVKDSLTRPVVLDEAGRARLVIPSGWTLHDPMPGAPVPLKLNTLQGLVDYLVANRDGLALEGLALHVLDPLHVELLGSIDGSVSDVTIEAERRKYRRILYACAQAEAARFSGFGNFVDAETFYIGLQTCFDETPHRDGLLKIAGTLKEGAERTTVDDGLAQEVTVRVGIRTGDREKLPNPVELAPYRTFREVQQPVSAFIVRARGGKDADQSDNGGRAPTLALFEADGGTWRLNAIENVAAWLRYELKDTEAKSVTVLA